MKVYIIKIHEWDKDILVSKIAYVVDSIQKADNKVDELTDDNHSIWCEIEEFEVQ